MEINYDSSKRSIFLSGDELEVSVFLRELGLYQARDRLKSVYFSRKKVSDVEDSSDGRPLMVHMQVMGEDISFDKVSTVITPAYNWFQRINPQSAKRLDDLASRIERHEIKALPPIQHYEAARKVPSQNQQSYLPSQ